MVDNPAVGDRVWVSVVHSDATKFDNQWTTTEKGTIISLLPPHHSKGPRAYVKLDYKERLTYDTGGDHIWRLSTLDLLAEAAGR